MISCGQKMYEFGKINDKSDLKENNQKIESARY